MISPSGSLPSHSCCTSCRPKKVPREAIILDEYGNTTQAKAQNRAAIMKELGLTSAVDCHPVISYHPHSLCLAPGGCRNGIYSSRALLRDARLVLDYARSNRSADLLAHLVSRVPSADLAVQAALCGPGNGPPARCLHAPEGRLTCTQFAAVAHDWLWHKCPRLAPPRQKLRGITDQE